MAIPPNKPEEEPSPFVGPSSRPSMSMEGRSMSELSTMTLISSGSSESGDEPDEPMSRSPSPSRPSTHPTTPSRPSTSVQEGDSSAGKGASTSRGVVVSAPVSNANLSRPIAIQAPVRRFGSVPERTPPEPLSARGDLNGGYFPMHEDPNVRVRPTHPFTHAAATGDPSRSRVVAGPQPTPGGPNDPVYYDSPPNHSFPPPREDPSATNWAVHASGRYYPDNYERRMQQREQARAARARNEPSGSQAVRRIPPTLTRSHSAEWLSPLTRQRAHTPPPLPPPSPMPRASALQSSICPADCLIHRPSTIPDTAPEAQSTPLSPNGSDGASVLELMRVQQDIFNYQRAIHAHTVAQSVRNDFMTYWPLPPQPMPPARQPMPPVHQPRSAPPPQTYVSPASSRSRRGMDLSPRQAQKCREAVARETQARRDWEMSQDFLHEMIDISLFQVSPWDPAPGVPVAQREPRKMPSIRDSGLAVPMTASAGDQGADDASKEKAAGVASKDKDEDKNKENEKGAATATATATSQEPADPASPVLNPMGILGTITPLALDPMLSPGGILGGANVNANASANANAETPA